MTTKTAYIVMWEYDTGGGFEWYRTQDLADKYFKKEKINVDALANYNWEARQNNIDVPTKLTDNEVTEYIDMHFDDIYDSSKRVYKVCKEVKP